MDFVVMLFKYKKIILRYGELRIQMIFDSLEVMGRCNMFGVLLMSFGYGFI